MLVDYLYVPADNLWYNYYISNLLECFLWVILIKEYGFKVNNQINKVK